MIPKLMSVRIHKLRASFLLIGVINGIISIGHAETRSDADINYSNTNYFYAPTPDRPTSFQSLRARGSLEVAGPTLESKASADFQLLLGSKVDPYGEAPEFYIGTSPRLNWKLIPSDPQSKIDLHIGRKLENWNQLDETWKLGLFQPRFRWDYFHPEVSGLTGFFVGASTTNFRLVAFASPLFIPERGVPIGVSNGELHSPTAWFIAPSSKIALFDQETRIRYQLEIPPVADMVLHPSAALHARLGRSQGPWISGAYAYKPVNQLLLGHDAYLKFAPPIEVPVTIRPRIIYHHLWALEGGYQTEGSGLTLSTIYESPVMEEVPRNWTIQTAKPAIIGGPSAYWLLGPQTRFDLGYLRRIGGNAPDFGRDAGPVSVFEARYPFASAFRLGLNTPMSFLVGNAARGFNLSTRLIYDNIEDGALWMNELRFAPRQRWELKLGADLLATEIFNGYRATEDSFISRYQVNNRIYAGVGYVF